MRANTRVPDVGRKERKGITLPEFSETGLSIARTTQELLRVQLREENIFKSQDHQILALFPCPCIHRGSQIILWPCDSKDQSADKYLVHCPGRIYIPNTALETNRMISRVRQQTLLFCKAQWSNHPNNFKMCIKVLQWIPTSLWRHSQVPPLTSK